MLPFGGQGSNQAIEDAGALGYLLKGVGDAVMTSNRLKMFEKVRVNRAARVQILSKTRIGSEKDVEEQLKEFTEGEDMRMSIGDHDHNATLLTFAQASLIPSLKG